VEDEIENLQFISLGVTKISKIIFYNGFLIFAIIPESKCIPTLGSKNIADYLDNLALYINKINLKPNKELQSITKSKKEYLLL
jgi:hypothetical protein